MSDDGSAALLSLLEGWNLIGLTGGSVSAGCEKWHVCHRLLTKTLASVSSNPTLTSRIGLPSRDLLEHLDTALRVVAFA